jgi:hypothetical protein
MADHCLVQSRPLQRNRDEEHYPFEDDTYSCVTGGGLSAYTNGAHSLHTIQPASLLPMVGLGQDSPDKRGTVIQGTA